MIRRTPVRKKRSKPRRGPMRDKGYRNWLKEQPCAVSDRIPLANGHVITFPKPVPGVFTFDCEQQTDPAHTVNNGMGSKGPDSSCAPLCRKHHREYDAGREAFENKYGVDMKKIAAQNWARYESERAA